VYLDHEVRNDAMERRPFVPEAFFARAQATEVLRRLAVYQKNLVNVDKYDYRRLRIAN